MSDSISKCYKCKYFDRYYVKDIKRFNRTEMGWCCEKRESVKVDGGCDKFDMKPPSKKSERILAVSLSEILAEISELRNIIEEERNERAEMREL